ncbi:MULTISPECIES: methyltransferase [Serratia]|uniref:methyltransferase n=1 Tax=Serratia TaxID=613 RepID=UPI00068F5236|nr:methyltransferase [Serratia marcescens]MBN5332849.1 methyltransferase [Serratia marcescens]MBN5337493.1 methyltransferase [Serratia marcescens]MCW7556778.1 methyltransferase [Serratia marcescens]MCW7561682.1 methyltransferase [Serratia marcescens]MCW7567714.1 methyltransferase [Serratia marcescens]
MRLAVIPPRCHDRNILDITMNLYTYPTIIIAHRLGVFEFMSKSPRNINDISTELQIKKRPAEAIMATLRALNLVELNAGLFRLTSEAQEFLLKGSPNYFGYFWDMMYENSENFSLKNLESAIRKDTAQVYRERALFDTHAHDTEKARKFTHAMHSLSMGSASVWPTALSLASHRKALDIGGASGAHAIGMSAHWPNLQCTIFDLPEVCPLSADYIRQYGFDDRIGTHCGNMWHDDYPAADLHFYSNIFHDWPTEKNRFLAQKSYASLPKGGRIVIHEILYDDTEPGPLAAAAYSLMMLGWTEGQQYSGKEIGSLLSEAGFENIEVFPALGYFSIVTAIKK